jgi:hypothetical protein
LLFDQENKGWGSDKYMQSATEREWSGILTFGDSNWACQISLYSVTPHMLEPELEFSDRPLRLSYISEGEDNLYLNPKIRNGTGLIPANVVARRLFLYA